MNKKIIEEIRLFYSIIIYVNVIIIVSSYTLRFIEKEDFNMWLMFSSGVVAIYGIFLFITLLSFWKDKSLKVLIVFSFYLLVIIGTLTVLLSPVKVPIMSFVGSILMAIKFTEIDSLKNDS